MTLLTGVEATQAVCFRRRRTLAEGRRLRGPPPLPALPMWRQALVCGREDLEADRARGGADLRWCGALVQLHRYRHGGDTWRGGAPLATGRPGRKGAERGFQGGSGAVRRWVWPRVNAGLSVGLQGKMM